MILPTLRASFGRRDALHLVRLMGGDDPDLTESAQNRLEADGLDALLDDPRARNALLTDPRTSASPALIFYVLVRQALLEGGLNDRALADYVATLLLQFGEKRKAYKAADADEVEYHYLVDIKLRIEKAEGRERFLLVSHLGNYALWLSGVFPHYLEERERRRGAPSLGYYEKMGAGGFLEAADHSEANNLGLDEIFQSVGNHFRGVRVALNRISDRVMWPGMGDPVSRLLREVEQGLP